MITLRVKSPEQLVLFLQNLKKVTKMILDKTKAIKSVSYTSLIHRIIARLFGEAVYYPGGYKMGYKLGKYIYVLTIKGERKKGGN